MNSSNYELSEARTETECHPNATNLKSDLDTGRNSDRARYRSVVDSHTCDTRATSEKVRKVKASDGSSISNAEVRG